MKHLFTLLFLYVLTSGFNAQTSNFTITNISGTSTLTCNQTSIFLTANTTVAGPVYFHWAGPSFNFTGPSATVTQAGTYTVTALDSMNFVFGTQYVSIISNTVPPISSVSPNTQTIACNTTTVGVPVTSNASGNVTHTFISPYGPSVTSNLSVTSYTPLGPGTYTHILLDNTTGCQSSSTFTLTSNQAFPTFSVTSPQNYTLGCGSKSVATISIINAATSPTPGGPVSYTFMPLSESNPAPSGILSPVSVYSITVPGLYYVIVKDNTNNCSTQIPVTIIANTVTPNIGANIPTQILDCNVTQVVLSGSSTSTNTSTAWSFIGTPGSVSGSTVLVLTNLANPSQTLINTYTFNVTDNNNLCKSTTVVPVYRNVYPPNAIIATGGNYTLTCSTPTIVLTNQSTTGIPPASIFPSNLPVVGSAWTAPFQPSVAMSSTFVAATNGTYTLLAKDLNNGCTSLATAVLYGGCNLVGIEKNTHPEISLQIFPNPTNGVITVSLDEIQKSTFIEIYNSIGVLVKKQLMNSDKTSCNLYEYANGIYILHVTQNDKVLYTSKIVKE